MTIVSTRDFRANQTKFLDMALRGEHVVLRSRRGSVRLLPLEEEEEPKRDVTAEICQAMKDWKEYLETGKENDKKSNVMPSSTPRCVWSLSRS